ncbi:MAG: hypothetical protein ABI600_10485, partial [Luteolibacter sp.]
MTEELAMVCLGILLVVAGFTVKTVRGAMPGTDPGYPVPLRFRLILIFFGVVLSVLGVVRLIQI